MGDGRHNRLVATAGHVDHGKTTLLKALTGTDADRLEEEKKRGLTIDLGFAHMDLGEYRVGFVDVPGHHQFVKNMVTGVGAVQGALFVVSARDGWQQQSQEHFQILSLLEPDFVCFALTKIDLVDDDFRLIVEAEIEEAIDGTSFEDSPVVPVSGVTREGLEELNSTLLNQLESGEEPADLGKPYLPVDRVFSLEGQGTVVTGSLSSGRLTASRTVELQPAGTPGRIRSIQAYGESLEEIGPGTRTALNVPEWERSEVHRGMVVAGTGAGAVTRRADGMAWLPPNASHRPEHDHTLMAYHGTFRGEARLLLSEPGPLGEEPSPARLLWKDEVFVRPGDRVILRDFGDHHVLGVVEILETDSEETLRSTTYIEFLRSRFPFSVRRYVDSELQRISAVPLEELADGSPYAQPYLKQTADEMKSCRLVDGVVLRKGWLEQFLADVSKTVARWHEDHPLAEGMPLERAGLPGQDRVRNLLLDRLDREGLVQDGTVIRRKDFRPTLADADRETYENLLEQMEQSGLEGPAREDLEVPKKLISFAVREGTLIELTEDRLVHRDVFDDLVTRLRVLFEKKDKVRLSDVRDELNSSRKYVIPLMESLDQAGYTHRDGDFRIWVGDDE